MQKQFGTLFLGLGLVLVSPVLGQDLKLGDEDSAETGKGKVMIPEGRSRLMDAGAFKQMANVPAPAAACPAPVVIEKKISPKDFDKRLKALMLKAGKGLKPAQKMALDKELRKMFSDVVGQTVKLEQKGTAPAAIAAPQVAAPAAPVSAPAVQAPVAPAPVAPAQASPAPAAPAPAAPAALQPPPPPPPPAPIVAPAPAAPQAPAVAPAPVAPKNDEAAKKAEARIAEINKLIEDPKLPWTDFEKLLNERKELEKQLGKPKTINY